MSPRFSSAQEYLDYVKWARGVDREALRVVSDPHISELNAEVLVEPERGEAMYETGVREHWKILMDSLDDQLAKTIVDYVAVGAVRNMDVNAVCAKSQEGFYAIVMNYGLLTALQILSQLSGAFRHPKQVTYCSSCAASQMTSQYAKELMARVVTEYRENGFASPVWIVLEETTRRKQMQQLSFWKLFILAHELSHILDGHLNTPLEAPSEESEPMSATFMESVADVMAYTYARKAFYLELGFSKDELAVQDDRVILRYIFELLDILYQLGSSGTETHADPRFRIWYIASRVYGEEVSEKLLEVLKTYDELAFARLFATPIIPISDI